MVNHGLYEDSDGNVKTITYHGLKTVTIPIHMVHARSSSFTDPATATTIKNLFSFNHKCNCRWLTCTCSREPREPGVLRGPQNLSKWGPNQNCHMNGNGSFPTSWSGIKSLELRGRI
ncbi:hypothetical protein BX666DRAFT_1881897 [Dichotomocladium elegans]|nr:hypothetical protein BX666DRAFT_1881897 [Dichotomocladium elegans]